MRQHTDDQLERRSPGLIRFELHGEIDCANVVRLGNELAAALDATDADAELDLVDVDFVSVAGVRMLLELGRGLEAQGRRLTLANPPPLFERVAGLITSAA